MIKLLKNYFTQKCPKCDKPFVLKELALPVAKGKFGKRVPFNCPHCGTLMIVRESKRIIGMLSAFFIPIIILLDITSEWTGIPKIEYKHTVIIICIVIFLYTIYSPRLLKVYSPK